ncbi:hypothetical protein DFA_03410 [Cavenderia fasciculata]|uniref:Uncharacterized protein n=1 Tax=Cavenderia fasciculata TaxID=261658 RepID=F4PHH8_CACFS|nr:uncharacterized protein DFA_03410 [Cavenderia fasciculata]EGG25162.1 hypothetical protein DFA_03410 [Cavenderia fasciculata]|eukprot:XP_004363013.1 hypothetical protein DFA_03410 [Cavenderia fasciculata]
MSREDIDTKRLFSLLDQLVGEIPFDLFHVKTIRSFRIDVNKLANTMIDVKHYFSKFDIENCINRNQSSRDLVLLDTIEFIEEVVKISKQFFHSTLKLVQMLRNYNINHLYIIAEYSIYLLQIEINTFRFLSNLFLIIKKKDKEKNKNQVLLEYDQNWNIDPQIDEFTCLVQQQQQQDRDNTSIEPVQIGILELFQVSNTLLNIEIKRIVDLYI